MHPYIDLLNELTQENLPVLTKRVLNTNPIAFERLKVEKTEDSFIMVNVMDHCLAALMKCGDVVEEDMEEHILVGVIQSGFMNLNPVLITMKADDENERVYIQLSARENYISQHSVEKALKRFKEINY